MAAVPAHLPQAVVRFLPARLEVVHERLLQVPGVVLLLQPGLAGEEEAVEDLAPDVELQLPGGLVADAHRRGPLVPLQPRQLHLRQPSGAVEGVHDLQVTRVARDRAQQPLPPGAGLLEVAREQHGLERVGGVAQPAVPVVPVPGAAELLRQGRRDGGHYPARGRVRHGLEDDEGPGDGLLPVPLDRLGAVPVAPELQGVLEGVEGVGPVRGLLVAAAPRQDEGDALALADDEVGHGAEVAALDRGGGPEPHRVRAGDGLQLITAAAHPRHDRAVVEAQGQLGGHADLALEALDDADHVGVVAARRHEVGDADGAVGGVPLGLQDQRGAPVATAGAAGAPARAEPPASGVRGVEQGREARG